VGEAAQKTEVSEVTRPLLHFVVPCPLSSAANQDYGQRRRKRGGKTGAQLGLPAKQRRVVEAALGWVCYCGAAAIPSQLTGQWLPLAPRYCCDMMRTPERRIGRRLRDPQDPTSWYLDGAGPERPLDLLLARIPSSPRGRELDDDNLRRALKAARDEAAARFWPPGLGKPNDSAPWLRWSYGQRAWQAGDPPNRGTELLEVVVAEREDVLAPAPAVLVRWQQAHGLAADVEVVLGRMADEVLASAHLLSPPTTAAQARALVVDRLRRGMEGGEL
jgi:hypothetical protein